MKSSPIIPFKKFVDVNDYLLKENWEKKKPFLKDSVIARATKEHTYKKMQKDDPQAFDDFIEGYLKSLYECDPVCVKTKGKKTPFVNVIWSWAESEDIRLPEDTRKVNEILQAYRDLKTSGEILKPVEEFKTFGSLWEYIKGVEPQQDYSEYLNLVGVSGLWRVYKITQWTQAQKALKDSSWCVQYFNNFDSDYYTPKVFFLVCRRDNEESTKEKRFALIHVQSGQIHNTSSKDISGELPQDLARLLLSIPECMIAPPPGEDMDSINEFIGNINDIDNTWSGVAKYGSTTFNILARVMKCAGYNSIIPLTGSILNESVVNAIRENPPAMFYTRGRSDKSLLGNLSGPQNQHNMVQLFKASGIYDAWVDECVIDWLKLHTNIPLDAPLALFTSDIMGTPKSYEFFRQAFQKARENPDLKFTKDIFDPLSCLTFTDKYHSMRDIDKFFNANGHLPLLSKLLNPPKYDPSAKRLSDAEKAEFGEIIDPDNEIRVSPQGWTALQRLSRMK